jgi:hypothetical protein
MSGLCVCICVVERLDRWEKWNITKEILICDEQAADID